jgi:predicted methyltransferase
MPKTRKSKTPKTRKLGGAKYTRILSRAYGPVGEFVNATGNSVKEVASYAGNVVKRSAFGARKLGTIWTNHTNMAIQKIRNTTGTAGNRAKASRKKASRRRSRK